MQGLYVKLHRLGIDSVGLFGIKILASSSFREIPR